MATRSVIRTKSVAAEKFRGLDHVVGLFATKRPGTTRISLVNLSCICIKIENSYKSKNMPLGVFKQLTVEDVHNGSVDEY